MGHGHRYKERFSNPIIFATQPPRPKQSQTMTCVRYNNKS